MSKVQNLCQANQVTYAPGMEKKEGSFTPQPSAQPKHPDSPRSDKNSYQSASDSPYAMKQLSRYNGELVQLARIQTSSAYRQAPDTSTEQTREEAFKLLKGLKNAGELTDAQWQQMSKALTGDTCTAAAESQAHPACSPNPENAPAPSYTPEEPTPYRGSPCSSTAAPSSAPVRGNMTFREAAQVLLQHFPLLAASSGDRGLINRQDLEAALTQPDLSPEIKQAAQTFLNNRSLFHAVDIAGDCLKRHDGEIHVNDLRAFLNDPTFANQQSLSSSGTTPNTQATPASPDTQTGPTMSLDDAVRTLGKYFDWFASATGDAGLIDKKDLESVLQQPGLPDEMKQAAQTLLNNPSFFRTLDKAGDMSGKSDGEIHRNDLNAYVVQRGWGLRP